MVLILLDQKEEEDGKDLASIDPDRAHAPQKCDGVKPACQQCRKAKKPDQCEYDDGKGKTRTQILRENIQRLEARIKELEDPDHAAPAVQLFDPHFVEEARRSFLTSSIPQHGDRLVRAACPDRRP